MLNYNPNLKSWTKFFIKLSNRITITGDKSIPEREGMYLLIFPNRGSCIDIRARKIAFMILL